MNYKRSMQPNKNTGAFFFVAKWQPVSLTWKGLNQFSTIDGAQAIATATRLAKHHKARGARYRVMRASKGEQEQIFVTD